MKNLWLIGAGQMAVDYAKVLNAQAISFTVIGRSKKTAFDFEENQNVSIEYGGIESYVKKGFKAKYAIISVGIADLFQVTITTIDAGVKTILIEKPAGVSFEQISELANIAKKKAVDIYVAYNRRFYESVIEARKIIKNDGGVKSFVFDFTELGNQVNNLELSSPIKEFWLLANSSHVIDLAFHLCGKPTTINSIIRGGNSWHPSGSLYVGSGCTAAGAVFSYHANWDSAGRWGLEIITPKRRLILRPLEQLQQMLQDSFNTSFIKINQDMNNIYKPGLYKQLKAFLNNESSEFLCSINEHKRNIKFYSKISGY